MRFVNNDFVEITMRKHIQPLFTHKRLNAADGYTVPTAETALLSLFHGANKPRGFSDFISRLVEKLATVCKNQNSVAVPHAVLGYFGKYDCFSAACRQDKQGFIVAVLPL